MLLQLLADNNLSRRQGLWVMDTSNNSVAYHVTLPNKHRGPEMIIRHGLEWKRIFGEVKWPTIGSPTISFEDGEQTQAIGNWLAFPTTIHPSVAPPGKAPLCFKRTRSIHPGRGHFKLQDADSVLLGTFERRYDERCPGLITLTPPDDDRITQAYIDQIVVGFLMMEEMLRPAPVSEIGTPQLTVLAAGASALPRPVGDDSH
jgi:hypothetical protein